MLYPVSRDRMIVMPLAPYGGSEAPGGGHASSVVGCVPCFPGYFVRMRACGPGRRLRQRYRGDSMQVNSHAVMARHPSKRAFAPSWVPCLRTLLLAAGLLLVMPVAQAAQVQHLNTQSGTASGSGAGGKPTIAASTSRRARTGSCSSGPRSSAITAPRRIRQAASAAMAIRPARISATTGPSRASARHLPPHPTTRSPRR